MEKSSTLFVGLDAHKNSIDIATADGTAAETAKFDTWWMFKLAADPKRWISVTATLSTTA